MLSNADAEQGQLASLEGGCCTQWAEAKETTLVWCNFCIIQVPADVSVVKSKFFFN